MSISDLSKVATLALPRQKAQFFVAMAIGVWLTFWVAKEVRTIEMSIDKKVKDGLEELNTKLNAKIDSGNQSIVTKVDALQREMWTVRMMAEYNQVLGNISNPTNRYPDVYRIFWDVRDGRIVQ